MYMVCCNCTGNPIKAQEILLMSWAYHSMTSNPDTYTFLILLL